MEETVTGAAEVVAVATLVLEIGAVGYAAADELAAEEAAAEDDTGATVEATDEATDEAAELTWPAQPELSMRKGCDHWKIPGEATMVMVRP